MRFVAQLFMCSLYLSCFFSIVSGGVLLCRHATYNLGVEHSIVLVMLFVLLILYESNSPVVFKPLSCVTGPMTY